MIGHQIAISTLSTFGLLRKDGFLATKLLSDSGNVHPKRWEKKQFNMKGFGNLWIRKTLGVRGPIHKYLGHSGFPKPWFTAGKFHLNILMKRNLYQPSLSFVTYMGDFL